MYSAGKSIVKNYVSTNEDESHVFHAKKDLGQPGIQGVGGFIAGRPDED